jgi:hypothetical protein
VRQCTTHLEALCSTPAAGRAGSSGGAAGAPASSAVAHPAGLGPSGRQPPHPLPSKRSLERRSLQLVHAAAAAAAAAAVQRAWDQPVPASSCSRVQEQQSDHPTRSPAAARLEEPGAALLASGEQHAHPWQQRSRAAHAAAGPEESQQQDQQHVNTGQEAHRPPMGLPGVQQGSERVQQQLPAGVAGAASSRLPPGQLLQWCHRARGWWWHPTHRFPQSSRQGRVGGPGSRVAGQVHGMGRPGPHTARHPHHLTPSLLPDAACSCCACQCGQSHHRPHVACGS